MGRNGSTPQCDLGNYQCERSYPDPDSPDSLYQHVFVNFSDDPRLIQDLNKAAPSTEGVIGCCLSSQPGDPAPLIFILENGTEPRQAVQTIFKKVCDRRREGAPAPSMAIHSYVGAYTT
jgi:hypothetical protein